VLKLQHRFAEAAESYLAALRLHPADLLAKRELSAFGYDELTIEAARQGGVLPSPPAVFSVAVADRARGKRQWSSAAQHYAEALRAQAQWAAIWVQLGHAQKEQGDLIGAEGSYRRSMTIEPSCADTHLQLGHVLKLRGCFAEAAASYFNAVQLEPKAVDGLRARKV
jgi:cytochrome c-type biogenesis protein CcmH/NrfG